jgi:hypothetical protein
MRYIGMLKATASSEAGEMPSPELMEKMGKFMEEVTQAGVLLATDGLKPSSDGKRVKLADGSVSVIDGPFTESKELIASYAIFETRTIDEAVEWTARFLKVLGSGECEIRPIWEFSDFPESVFPADGVAREQAWRDEMAKRAQSA